MIIKLSPMALFSGVIFIIGSLSEIRAEYESLCIYETVITPEDRVNSRGVALIDPGAILVQERANAHRNGEAGEAYFTTPARRAKIPEMLKRGDFDEAMKNAVIKGDDPVLFIEARRDKSGVTSMMVTMRARYRDDYEEIRAEIENSIHENVASDEVNVLDSLQIEKPHPHYQTIMTLVEKSASEMAEEPVLVEGRIYLLDDWARVNGHLHTKSGKAPVQADESLFDLDFISALRRVNGKWHVIHRAVAGDIQPLIDIQKNFPTIPEFLFPRLPDEVMKDQ